MTDSAESLVEGFVNIWNERDSARRRQAVETLWAANGRHYMGAHDVGGHDALEARVSASHQRNVVEGGGWFRPPTAVQVLPGVVKFRWDLAKRDTDEVLSAGVGFLTRDASGKILADYLFVES
ncbi:MAG: hypothetical protein E7774_10905 [Bradyrhizobium sp.]|nr:MAG: hypothetical protein E7774_10905 [Bradyrhizobium sp.]